jgi:hypothetical protein
MGKDPGARGRTGTRGEDYHAVVVKVTLALLSTAPAVLAAALAALAVPPAVPVPA